jgi:hypothetical protein
MNKTIKAISMSLLLAMSMNAFSLSAPAQEKLEKMDGVEMGKTEKMEAVIGKKGILHLNSSFRAGDALLKSGTYQAQHVQEGGNHIIVLREVPSGQGFRGGNTIPGKEVARLMCDYAPSVKRWRNTTVMLRANDKGEKEVAEIHVAGEKFVHTIHKM